VEEILHEGPLKPNHDGAFEIKKDYMDMSSSDDETPAKKHDDLYFKTSEEKKVKHFIEFEPGFNFENQFLIGNGA
jgi:hypothetical protein